MTNSMTAFARLESQNNFGTLVWEIRSLNHRFLDINLRLPENFRQLENVARSMMKKVLSRGKIDAGLYFVQDLSKENTIELNHKILQSVSDSLSRVGDSLGAHQQINVMDVLAWPGVVEQSTIDFESVLNEAEKLLQPVLTELVKARKQEGKKLKQFVIARLDALEPLVQEAKSVMPKAIKAQKQKLKTALDEIMEQVDAGRLEQEVAVLAQKMDIDEEMDRMNAHISKIRAVLKWEEPIGRRLDFLMQELHREANTLGSKSQDIDTTSAALEMKVIIEQMREQVQNIE